MSERNQIAMIWITLIGGTIFFLSYAGLVGMFPPPPADLGAKAVAEFYTSNNMQIRIGAALCVVTGGFIVPWSVVVSAQMARLEEGPPVLAILQALGGALGCVIYMIPAMFWGIAAFTVTRDPELTLLMHEVALLMLVAPWSFFPLQILPITVVALTQRKAEYSAFPRWVGYLCGWTALITLPGVMCLLIKTGPFAWNGLLAFWLPVGIYFVWIVTLSITMSKAIKQQAAAKKSAVKIAASLQAA